MKNWLDSRFWLSLLFGMIVGALALIVSIFVS
jgi:hypothetical protein